MSTQATLTGIPSATEVHYRKAAGVLRCSHKHRTPRAAWACAEVGAAHGGWSSDVVECSGNPEHERPVANPSLGGWR